MISDDSTAESNRTSIGQWTWLEMEARDQRQDVFGMMMVVSAVNVGLLVWKACNSERSPTGLREE